MASTADMNVMKRHLYGGSTRSGTLSTGDLGYYADNAPNLYIAASRAALAEAGASVGGSKQVGDLKIDRKAEDWHALSKRLRIEGVRSVKPYSGGISVADSDSQAADTDWRRGPFRVGRFDNPGASTST